MPTGGKCSICSRPDADLLTEMVKNGASARHVAMKYGIHVRVFQQHLTRHAGNPIGRHRSASAGGKARGAELAKVSVLAEAQTLYNRALTYLDKAVKADSQRDARGWISEVRECLKLLGNASGELATGSAVQVNLGISVDRARQAVEIVDAVEALSPAEVADRAVAALTAYNLEYPHDARAVSPRLLTDAQGDGGDRHQG